MPDPANTGPVGVLFGILPADPLRRPVAIVEQAHLPPRRLGPRRWFVPGVPDAHRPVISLPGCQLRSGVHHSNRFRGGLLAAVPDIGFLDAGGAGRNTNLIRRLLPVTLGAIALPRQPRRRIVDAHRVHQIIATQMDRCGNGGRRQQNRPCQSFTHSSKSLLDSSPRAPSRQPEDTRSRGTPPADLQPDPLPFATPASSAARR